MLYDRLVAILAALERVETRGKDAMEHMLYAMRELEVLIEAVRQTEGGNNDNDNA